jgi:uncharacterized protein (TIGR02145 family)
MIHYICRKIYNYQIIQISQTATLLTAVLLGTASSTTAQNVSISPTGNAPDNSAALDIRDYTDKGVLIPRLTTAQRNAIPSPANSLLIFNTTTGCYEFRDGSKWVILSCGEKCNKPILYYDERFNEGLNYTNVKLRWTPVVGATGYSVSVSKNKQFTSFVIYNNGANSYNNVGVGNVTSMRINWDTVICNYPYFAVVSASTSCGIISSDTIEITTKCLPSCGSQVWMTANMNVGTMINDPAEQNNDSQVEKYCYGNTPANCTTYGGLYQWTEAVGEPYNFNFSLVGGSWQSCDPCGSSGRQGICPAGYHIPTDLEWSRYEWCVENNIVPAGGTSLSTFQGTPGWRGSTSPTAGPGSKLKASASNSPAWNGTNASGFTALPAGYRPSGGGFNTLGSNAYFWSATENGHSIAWSRILTTGNWHSNRNSASKANGFSVRCLQN